MSTLQVAAALLLVALPAPSSNAGEAKLVSSDWHIAHASRVRLVGGGLFNAADPNSPRVAGVEIRLDPNWKTYWRMPGEAGVPPQFDWSKSENVASVDVLYPAPRRYPDKGGDAVGYSGSVIFPVIVTPKDATKPVKLSLEMAFGVCKDICVPLETTLGVDILRPAAGTAPPPALKDMLDRVPRQATGLRKTDPRVTSVTGAVSAAPRTVTVVTEASADAPVEDVFLEGADGRYVPMARRVDGATETKASFSIDFGRLSDAADYVGKPIRITVVGRSGASETVDRKSVV